MSTWKCKDGRVLEISGMDTQHIQNTLAMLRRKGFMSPDEAVMCMTNPPTGDGAYDAWESEMDAIRVSHSIPHLEKELAKRNP